MADDIDRFVNEITAHTDLIVQNAESCPHLAGVGLIISIADEARRRKRLRRFLHKFHSELSAELSALGIEPTWPAAIDSPSETNSPGTGDSLTALTEEIEDKKRFADSNRRRAYVNSTF